jgi:hypothetical protein
MLIMPKTWTKFCAGYGLGGDPLYALQTAQPSIGRSRACI